MSGSGFISRLFGGRRQPDGLVVERPFELAHAGFSSVVGESNYQEALARTARLAQKEVDEEGEERPCFRAILVREPSNPYDTRAVAVYSRAGLIGYAPRGSQWCELLDVLARRGHGGAACRANLCGGDAGRSWGVVLHARPDLELEKLT